MLRLKAVGTHAKEPGAFTVCLFNLICEIGIICGLNSGFQGKSGFEAVVHRASSLLIAVAS